MGSNSLCAEALGWALPHPLDFCKDRMRRQAAVARAAGQRVREDTAVVETLRGARAAPQLLPADSEQREGGGVWPQVPWAQTHCVSSAEKVPHARVRVCLLPLPFSVESQASPHCRSKQIPRTTAV